jgi:hypothetical protein
MLNVIFAECRKQAHYAECHYVECRYAECRYAECHYAECCYAVCRYVECRGARLEPLTGSTLAKPYPQILD